MKNVSLENITSTVVGSFDKLPHERTRVLVQTLVKHLHGFAKETNLSHAEWRSSPGLLHPCDRGLRSTRSLPRERRRIWRASPLVGHYQTIDDMAVSNLLGTPNAPCQVMNMDFRLATQTATR